MDIICAQKPSRQTKALIGENINDKGKKKKITSIGLREAIEFEGYIEELEEEPINFKILTSMKRQKYAKVCSISVPKSEV